MHLGKFCSYYVSGVGTQGAQHPPGDTLRHACWCRTPREDPGRAGRHNVGAITGQTGGGVQLQDSRQLKRTLLCYPLLSSHDPSTQFFGPSASGTGAFPAGGTGPLPVAASAPEDGCTRFTNAVTGKAVLIRRGGVCSFAAKVGGA